MTAGREIELKLRVDDLADLMKVASASGGVPVATATQINTYFDTSDQDLIARGFIVRLREERRRPGPARFFATAKGPAQPGTGPRVAALTSVLEEEVEVDAATTTPLAHLEGGPDSRRALLGAIRGALGTRALVRVGSFQNERTRIPVELGGFRAVLELDRVHFPGDQVHHEVEMEVPDGVSPDVASAAFRELFRRAGVAGRIAPGKARRFFAALRGERLDP